MKHDEQTEKVSESNVPVPVETGLRRVDDHDGLITFDEEVLPAKPDQPLAEAHDSAQPGERRRITNIDDDDFDDTMGGGYATVKGEKKNEHKLVWIVLITMTVICIAVGICSSVLTGYFMRRGAQPADIDTVVNKDAISAVVKLRKPCIVEIEAHSQTESLRGSGVITKLDRGKIYILTNYHVISPSFDANGKINVRFSGDDAFFVADLVGYESYYDVAVISVDSSVAPYEVITLDGTGNFSPYTEYAEGDFVVAIGNAMGYGIASYSGIVSRCFELIDYTSNGGDKAIPVMRTTAAINAGMSGGALFDCQGRVIGLSTYRMTSSSNSSSAGHGYDVEDTGFVTPISIVYPLYRQILDYGNGGSVSGALPDMTFVNSKTMSNSKTSVGAIRFMFKGFGGFTAEYRNGKLTVIDLDAASPATGLKVNDVIKSIGAASPVTVSENICELCGEMLRYRHNAYTGALLTLNVERGTQSVSVKIDDYYKYVS